MKFQLNELIIKTSPMRLIGNKGKSDYDDILWAALDQIVKNVSIFKTGNKIMNLIT